MKTHKIIDAVQVLSAKQLKSLRLSKEECFSNYDGTFDYAIPQDWLYSFSDWCKANPARTHNVTYDLIIATTCWAYPESEPVTCCADVAYAYRRYSNPRTVETDPQSLTSN